MTDEEWVNWLVRFANTNLLHLREKEKELLLDDLKEFLSPPSWSSFTYPLKAITVANLEPLQKLLKEHLNTIVNYRGSEKIVSFGGRLGIEKFQLEPNLYQDKFILGFKPIKKESVEDWFNLKFFLTVSSLQSVSSIRKCKGCGKFFFSLRKGKIFCNTACAQRTIARERREALKSDPKKYEAFLRKMRRYMKKKRQLERRHRNRNLKKA